jgi:hypothetical protein
LFLGGQLAFVVCFKKDCYCLSKNIKRMFTSHIAKDELASGQQFVPCNRVQCPQKKMRSCEKWMRNFEDFSQTTGNGWGVSLGVIRATCQGPRIPPVKHVSITYISEQRTFKLSSKKTNVMFLENGA